MYTRALGDEKSFRDTCTAPYRLLRPKTTWIETVRMELNEMVFPRLAGLSRKIKVHEYDLGQIRELL